MSTPDNSRSQVNPTLVVADFHELFEQDPEQGVRQLLRLLRSRATTEARAIMLEQAAQLGEPADFIRELCWIADRKLQEALKRGVASPQVLGQLASHPASLRVASGALADKDSLRELIAQCQVRTWHWLLDLDSQGELSEHGGKDVGAWWREQPLDTLRSGASDHEVRVAVAQEFMVPMDLVATTYVDAPEDMLQGGPVE